MLYTLFGVDVTRNNTCITAGQLFVFAIFSDNTCFVWSRMNHHGQWVRVFDEKDVEREIWKALQAS